MSSSATTPGTTPTTPSGTAREDTSRRLPEARVYLLGLVLFVGMIGALEVYWRGRAFEPNVPDSPDLWAYHWSRVVGNDPNLIVAIGTSRIRTAVRPDVIQERLPSQRLIQLGVNGPSGSLGLLAEISRIPHFRGLVLCDLLPPLMAPEQGREQVAMARRPNTTAHTLNTYLRSLLCDRLVVLNSALSVRNWFARRDSFRPESVGPRLRVHADRTLEISYPTDEALKTIRENRFRDYAGRYSKARRYKNMDEFREAIRDVADSVARIKQNGGKVVFLRLPAAGARLQLEEATYPSALYFGVLAETTSAPWIDFRELSHEDDLDCPDESHLSADSAPVFTSRLVERLRRGSLLGQ
jgi:hypothetical protein